MLFLEIYAKKMPVIQNILAISKTKMFGMVISKSRKK